MVIALVQDAVVEKEFGCESSQELSIIDRCPCGIFLSLKIPLHVVVPRFLFCIKFTTVCWFIEPLNDDLGSLVVPSDFEHRCHGSQSVCQLILFSWNMIKSNLFEVGDQTQNMLSIGNKIRMLRIPLAFYLTNHQS